MSAHPAPKPAAPLVAINLDRGYSTKLITIRWGVSRKALGERAPSGTSPLIELEMRVDPRCTLTWVLIDPQVKMPHQIELKSSKTQITITESASAIILSSPHLRAHLHLLKDGMAELVYVHTDVFTDLHIPGGRYEPIGCSVEAHKKTRHAGGL